MKSRIADSTSVFLEERYQHGTTMTGLTHATGITFAPTERWNLGLNTDIGTLQDRQTGAETERLAGAIQVGFGTHALQLASGIEYRFDDAEQPDLTRTERTTWLFRNSFKYQLNPGSRLLGKFNHSTSESSLGSFYDGGFTEAVLGYAYRPIRHDRLNTMVKYTYFYNVPTTGQMSVSNVAAEFIQKSHVAAIDLTYDLTHNFRIGGKYGYRLGQVSLDRESPEFFDNNAHLYVLRGDYTFRDNWEFLLETRMLSMPDLDEKRVGALATTSPTSPTISPTSTSTTRACSSISPGRCRRVGRGSANGRGISRPHGSLRSAFLGSKNAPTIGLVVRGKSLRLPTPRRTLP